MLNKNLDLKSAMICLNLLIKDLVDYDWDTDGIIYLAVDLNNCKSLLNYMLGDTDYEKYIKDFQEDDTVDITGIWGEICGTFNAEIWVNTKQKRFYICRLYHKFLEMIRWYKSNIQHKLTSLKWKIVFKVYRYKEKKQAEKRLKQLRGE